MIIVVFNPGGNSLKAQVVRCNVRQSYAFEGEKILSWTIDGIGEKPTLTRLKGKRKIASEVLAVENYEQAAIELLKRLVDPDRDAGFAGISKADAVAIRVVHGGRDFEKPARITSDVVDKITDFEKLAPLHNKSSIEVLGPVRRQIPDIPVYAVFDTAFHLTMPDYASTYPIPQELAKKHRILRYGFHGISHRYLLERYAHLCGKRPDQCSIVTMHLESGCSVTAIQHGKSVDNTMGLTPLEGLMMGTRSGDVDPSIVQLLMREEHMSIDDVMTLLNKKSGLMGVSEVSLDTRILAKQYDSNPHVKLAMDIFAYKVRKAVGAYMAALGSVNALIFGGGIAENTTFVRKFVCDGLQEFGIDIDREANERLIDIEGKLSKPESRIQAWVIPTEEGLEIAHECCLIIR